MKRARIIIIGTAIAAVIASLLIVVITVANASSPAPVVTELMQQPPQSGPLTYATASNSSVTKHLTAGQLRQIYACTLPPATQANFVPALPRRTERIARTWIVDVLALPSPGPCVVEDIGGITIEENDLRAMTDPKMIVPVEINVWMRQMVGPDIDKTGSSKLNRLNGVDPLEPGPSTRAPHWPPGS